MLAVTAAAEIVVRTFRPLLSADIVHIRQIPSIARSVGEQKGLRVLFLGNSLTRRGVNLSVIRPEVSPNETPPVWLDKVNPDDTAILDWYYLFEKYFKGPDAPDFVVLGWAENQLGDHSHVHPDRIAAYYGGWSNTSEIFRNDLYDSGMRMDYLLSTVLASFSEKERIRTRLLTLAVPDYRSTAELFNSTMAATGKAAAPPAPSYHRLQRFLTLCRDRHVRVIAAAMPLPDSYPIDGLLRQTLDSNGAVLLDLRHVPGITSSDYADGYHLAPYGAELYSRELGSELNAVLSSAPAHPSALAVAYR